MHLYKYRFPDQRLIEFLESPTLYFADPGTFNDKFEVGAQLTIGEDAAAIEAHYQEYIEVLKEVEAVEKRLASRQYTRYLNDPDWEKEQYYLRRCARVDDYTQRIAYAERQLRSLKSKSGPDATRFLAEFYEDIRQQLKQSAICCLCGIDDSAAMWTRYANNHLGIAIELRDDDKLFPDRKIERFPVNYAESSTVHVLDEGYLGAYRKLHTTKTLNWACEQETRFFIFGSPRAVPIPRRNVASIILGDACLTGKGLSPDARQQHAEWLRRFCKSMLCPCN